MEACKLRLSLLNLSNNSLSGLPPELGKVSYFNLYSTVSGIYSSKFLNPIWVAML